MTQAWQGGGRSGRGLRQCRGCCLPHTLTTFHLDSKLSSQPTQLTWRLKLAYPCRRLKLSLSAAFQCHYHHNELCASVFYLLSLDWQYCLVNIMITKDNSTQNTTARACGYSVLVFSTAGIYFGASVDQENNFKLTLINLILNYLPLISPPKSRDSPSTFHFSKMSLG